MEDDVCQPYFRGMVADLQWPLVRSKLFTARVSNIFHISSFRYQDTHNQSFIMVGACERWMSVRVGIVCGLYIGSVALAAVLVSQDVGKRS